jgi:5-methylcytosine-specific restriction endonuclease McrA
LSLDHFAKNKARKDGLQNYCRKCGYQASKKYAQLHRAEAVARTRKWQMANAEKAKAAYKNYYDNTADYQKDRRAKYLQNNLERHASAQHKRRAKLKQNGVFDISIKELKRLYSAHCFYCGSKGPITLDHIIPIARGGRHSIGNLIAACRSCNSSKNDRLIVEWRRYYG